MARGRKEVDETAALFDALPSAARFELADLLGRLGRDILAEQLARVARRTGALAAGLTVALLTEQLKVRVGLLSLRNRLFYGLIVESGRASQTVSRTRKRLLPAAALKNKRRPGVGLPKPLKVTALPARPFVRIEEAEIDRITAQPLADFWSRALARAENDA